MRWTMTTISISSLLVLGGCIQDLVAQGAELAPDSDTDTGPMPTTGSSTPTTGTDPGAHTVTGEPDSETVSSPGSNSGDTANDPPPTISLFEVTPELVEQIGLVQVHMLASDDVVSADLELDGVDLEQFKTNQFFYGHDFLQEKQGKAVRTFKVVVRDAAEQTATAEKTIAVVLPPAGEQKCIFEAPDRGTIDSSISAVRYTKTAIVAVGTRKVGAEYQLTVWLLDPDTCQLLEGWPRSISDWSANQDFVDGRTLGTAVDIDSDGNIVVAGNRIVGTKPQSYVALLSTSGVRKWEQPGVLGDEVSGVAAGMGKYSDRVFVVGSRRTSDAPPCTDAAVWVYRSINGVVSVPPPITLKAPFTPDETDLDKLNDRCEWARAVVLNPTTGNALVAGEREFWPDFGKVFKRSFTAVIHPLGTMVGTPWTSPGDTGLVHDAARSVAVCDDGFVAGGWARDEPIDAKPRPIIFWLEADGSAIQQRTELQLESSQTNGIACDRQGKVVSAGTRTGGESDAQVFMVPDPFAPRVAYETGVPAHDGAGGVACDPRGFCAWGGFRTLEGKPYALVRAHHP